MDENPHKQVKTTQKYKENKRKDQKVFEVEKLKCEDNHKQTFIKNKDKSKLTKFEIDQLGVFARV